MSKRIQIIPDLGKFTPKDGTLYRPSNGTEGMYFEESLCVHCKRDAAYQENPENADGCPLIAAALAYDITHPKYPKQWIWKGGAPCCTEFADESDRITPEERAANLELFPEAA